ncbi:TadG family pilus assembly protein [Sphingobium chungbukense]|uniref:Membrane protein n=1 Tax=Sphingobium chungbukense TaxID=56193 RepID=A0A0M3ANI8_9SPHN|nr:TadG family pilus assembly protein [Sphingobium chungbukense]KKW91702.1 membrane protein [Sphingobium chungbukense]
MMRLFSSLRHDRSAAVAPMVAALGTVLIGAAGFALDAGLYYVGERNLRAATDAAAMAAAMNPAQAVARARDSLIRNGYDPAILRSVETGRYCADAGLGAAQRFDASMALCPGNGRVNAVRIRTGKPARQYLMRVLGPANPLPDLAASATATRIDEAGVGITSGILTVSNGLVNSVNDLLGALLGIKLRLSTADVEALMTSNIDAGLFFDALAQRVGESGTYGDLTSRTVGLRDLLYAAASAADNASSAATLTLIAGQVGNGYAVPLNGLFGLGVWRKMPVGGADEKPALRAGINAYQLFAFAVQAGNGTIDLSDAVSVVAGGSTVKIAAMASGPMDRPRFSFGPAGETSVGTSALRLQLLIGLGNIAVLGNAVSVDSLPVLIDIAAAQAQVTAIDCPDTAEQARDTRVTVHADTGLVNAYIGTAPANAMTRPMPPITAASIGQARIVNLLSLITVDARAVAQPVMGKSGNLVFGPGGQGSVGRPGAPGSAASIGNGSQAGPLLTSLSSIAAGNGLQVKILGLCLPLVCDATEAAVRTQLLNGITAPLAGLVGGTADPLLDNLLAALGIQLGHATLWATGARCGVPVLV